MNKIIFLDIDGVLNSHQSCIYFFRFDPGGTNLCPIALSNLKELIDRSNAKIVISSTWRLGDSEEWKHTYKLFENAGIKKETIIGSTPVLDGPRGEEIQSWLDKNEDTVSEFVIIDDDSDMGALSTHLVHTDSFHGFMYRDFMKALDILNIGDTP